MSEPRRIRPLGVAFIVVVFGILLRGVLGERSRPEDLRDAFVGEAEEVPTFEELALPIGPHALAGRVLHADGRPVENVQVFLHRVEALPAGAEPPCFAFTDAEGRFEVRELAAAEYQAVLHVSGYRPNLRTVTIPSAEEVVWRFGEPIEPLEALPDMRRATVAGRLVAADGAAGTGPARPLAGYEVVLRPAEGTHPLSGAVELRAITDAEGAFRFPDAVVVDYELELLPHWAAGGSWPVLAGRSLPAAQEERTALELPLAPGSIRARLVQSGERPVEGALVQLRPVDAPDRLWPPRSSDADGRFVIDALPPGRYLLRVHAGRAVHESEAVVGAGEDVELGTIRLAPSS